MTLEQLVDAFAVRERPISGVFSRSRLRWWFFKSGGTEEMWIDFAQALVRRNLWVPWHGHDIDPSTVQAEQRRWLP